MERILRYIDMLSESSGKLFAWIILILTGSLVYEVTLRYMFNAPTIWAWDLSYMLYGTHFMMGAAYTLKLDGNVRIDLFYRLLSDRKQAVLDACLYPLFFFPPIIALFVVSIEHASYSYQIRELTSMTVWRVPVYPFKAILPLASGLLLLQGLAEFIRLLFRIFGRKE